MESHIAKAKCAVCSGDLIRGWEFMIEIDGWAERVCRKCFNETRVGADELGGNATKESK